MILPHLGDDFASTREALHQVAYFAVSPARYRAVGRMGLRATHHGFGTPQFDGRVARVEDDLLVFEDGENVATSAITSIREAARFFGGDYEPRWFTDFHDPLPPMDPDVVLAIDRDSAAALGDWFSFGFIALERLMEEGGPEDDVSEPQLWPEHFDAAIELGDASSGRRASYGASPGDADHDQPYLYVAAWSDVDRGNAFWNDFAFNGASIAYSSLLAGSDPMGVALDFYARGRQALSG